MNIKTYHKIKLKELRRGNLAVLDHLKLDEGITFEKIERTVSQYTGVPVEAIYQKTRKREVVQARQLIHSFAKQNFRMSLESIGFRAGGKDHATVSHSCKTIDNLLDTDKSFKKLYQTIENALI
jgi:chromosomal replication initiator protein